MGQAAFYAYAYAFNITLLFLANKFNRGDRGQQGLPDFEPSTLASQGSPIPLLIGRRRVGAVFAWAGDRQSFTGTTTVRAKGSKKKRSTGQTVYSEAGWHILCVGPATRLNAIYQDGKAIWTGPIDPSTDESGSTLTMQDGTNDECRIYWGEEEQPVDDFLSDANRVGVASRWPFVCYIVWTRKTLGSSPRWPQIEYDIECQSQYAPEDPTFTPLSYADTTLLQYEGSSTGWLTGTVHDFVVPSDGHYRLKNVTLSLKQATHRNGVELQALPFIDDIAWHTPEGNARLRWRGNDVADLDCPQTVDDPTGEWVREDLPDEFNDTRGSGATYTGVARIVRTFEFATEFLPAGTHTLVVIDCVRGALGGHGQTIAAQVYGGATLVKVIDPTSINPMAALGQILFSEFPHGLGLSEDAFDLSSMGDVALALEAEGMTGVSIYAKSGEEAMSVVGEILSDAGVFVYRHPSTGLLTFALQRKGTASAVPAHLVAGKVPEINIARGERPATRLIFEFQDKDREFATTAVAIDEDGAAQRYAHHRARKVEMPTVIDLTIANLVAERRSQEELAGAAVLKVRLNRGARELYPGALVTLPDLDDVYRVMEVEPISNSGEVDVVMAPDYYGSEPSTYTAPSSGSSGSGASAPEEDAQATFIEVPAHLLDPGDPPHLIVLRVRAHDQVTHANLNLSIDDTTYRFVDADFSVQTGGELLEAIAADAPYVIDEGPTFEIAGPPDDDVVEDFTSDEANWKLGRQMCAIGDELFFLKKITALGGTTYRLDGLIRARYDTERAAHAIGDKVYIFQFDDVNAISDAVLVPGASVYVKPQPIAGTALSLADVTAINKTLKGKGAAPPKPCALRVSAPTPNVAGYRTGDDVTFKWASRLANPVISGAGMQGAGMAVGAGVIGATTAFEIKVYDATDTLVRTEVRSVNEWTYTNTDLTLDLSGETNFRVEVREFDVGSGFFSDAIDLTVEFLS